MSELRTWPAAYAGRNPNVGAMVAEWHVHFTLVDTRVQPPHEHVGRVARIYVRWFVTVFAHGSVAQVDSRAKFAVVWRGYRLRLARQAKCVGIDALSCPLLEGTLQVEKITEPASQVSAVMESNQPLVFSEQRPFALFPLTLETSLCLTHYRVPDDLNGETTNRLFAQRIKTPAAGEPIDFTPVSEPGVELRSAREARVLEPDLFFLSRYRGGRVYNGKLTRWNRLLMWHCDLPNGQVPNAKESVFLATFHMPVLVPLAQPGSVNAQALFSVLGASSAGLPVQLCRLIASYLSQGTTKFGMASVSAACNLLHRCRQAL